MLKQSIKWIILTVLTGSILISLFVVLFSNVVRQSSTSNTPFPVSPLESNSFHSVSVSDSAISSLSNYEPTSSSFVDSLPVIPISNQPDLVTTMLQEMTVEQKIGQLVMFGFEGKDRPSNDYSLLFETYHVSNFLLLTNNVDKSEPDGGFKRVAKMISSFHESCSVSTPVDNLFAIDVEGGKVTRFRWNPVLSSAADLGKANNLDSVYEQSHRIGQSLSETGILMNLSPVLDVSSNPESTYLGSRIISDNAEITASVGATIIQGLHDSGCLSAAKHFPGHGATVSNSHTVCPIVHKTLDEIQAYDLIPFYQAIESNVDAIMIAHISYPDIDPEHISTTSPVIIQHLLREEMGFSGIVISDDFRMKALTSSYSTSEAAVGFILAGGDMILCGPDIQMQTTIMSSLLSAFSSGTISEDRLNESVSRILKAKLAVSQ